MKIKEGEKLPTADFFYLDDNNTVQKVDTDSLFKDQKAILFGVPGAFTKVCSMKHLPSYVKNFEEAISHINKYGTMHTDSIITKNKETARKFLKNVKSSIAMHNTSTQFADGGEFGFGGEVGISTNKLPPRGPVGLAQLVSYKYEVVSNGKTRK